MSMAVDDLLDREAAAAHVGCSTFTIRYRMRHHGLTPARYMGQAAYFTREDLDAHFKERPVGTYIRRRA